jgi:hypothetical protein
VVAAVSAEGIFSAVTRSDLDSSAIHSVASLSGGFTIGTIPTAIANASKCGVRLRGFVRGPLTGAAVYTFTVALNVSGSTTLNKITRTEGFNVQRILCGLIDCRAPPIVLAHGSIVSVVR